LGVYEEGLAMQRLSLHRRIPDLPELEIDRALDRWLAREDEAIGSELEGG
jgi:hypothetical protein